eukprot:TRINITY_DN6669_c3_g1_i1.p1 TRINITY_DN6669_c3_g1~~TRINITY_DN6669_c3_g1_i1.p1  ORF type:complete len:263 (-),score=35.84 TRINITY_DN6669_c3_g1_i1:88-777(-)
MSKTGWEKLMDAEGVKKFGDHNDRNQGPILEKLLHHLPQCAADDQNLEKLRVLEVASGTGQHASFLGRSLHNIIWCPTDYDDRCVASTDLWTEELREKVLAASKLDVTSPPSQWPVAANSVDVVYNCNMIHLAPIEVLHGFAAGAGTVAKPEAKLFMYGPFKVDGKHVSESNEEFDTKLRNRDSSWGVRDVSEVVTELGKYEFELVEKEVMPANNFLLVFARNLTTPKL